MPTTASPTCAASASRSPDQDGALTFYLDVLGFEKRLDAPISPAMGWVEVVPPGARTSIALTAAAPGLTGVHLRRSRRQPLLLVVQDAS